MSKRALVLSAVLLSACSSGLFSGDSSSDDMQLGQLPAAKRALKQSEVLDGRRVLDERLAEMTERFGDKRIPLPPHWGGYRLKPDRIEFWQGRPNRLHDRFRYTRKTDGRWLIERLAP